MKRKPKLLTVLLLTVSLVFTPFSGWQPAASVQAAGYDGLSQDQKNSSYGFFAWMGCEAAMDVLTGAPLAGYTKIGASGDATSLENLYGTVQWLQEYNHIRTSVGLSRLNVSLCLMAAAESNINWSDTNIAHSKQFNVGENLAWGYKDPFTGWYYDEKALYDKYRSQGLSHDQIYEKHFHEVGHYLNIAGARMDKKFDYSYTGYGISTNGSYSNAHSQTFAHALPEGDVVLSVEELSAKLTHYITNVNPQKGIKSQKITGGTTSKSFKYKKLKKKAQSFSIKASAKTAVTYQLAGYANKKTKKAKKYFKVSSDGKVTVKKKCKKGTYKLKVRMRASENWFYKAAPTVVRTITIKVK